MRPKKAASPAKAHSPARAKGKLMFAKESPKKSSPKSRKATYVLKAIGFGNGMPLELYFYEHGTKDGYVWPYRQICDTDEASNATLEDAGFRAYYYRRVSLELNARMLSPADGFPKIAMVRYVPDMVPSSPESRREGLNLLKAFFMDPDNTNFPPPDIATIDITNEHDLQSVDTFIMADDVLEIMRKMFDDEFLNDGFYEDNLELARTFFASPTPPADAIRYLGYPSPEPNFANNANNDAQEHE